VKSPYAGWSLPVLAAALLIACAEDQESPEDRVRTYLAAIERKENDEICRSLSPTGVESLKTAFGALDRPDCLSVVEGVGLALRSRFFPSLRQPEIEDVEIDSGEARVEVAGVSGEQACFLVEDVDGEWRIADPFGGSVRLPGALAYESCTR